MARSIVEKALDRPSMEGKIRSRYFFLGCFEGGKGDLFTLKHQYLKDVFSPKVFWVEKRHQCC